MRHRYKDNNAIKAHSHSEDFKRLGGASNAFEYATRAVVMHVLAKTTRMSVYESISSHGIGANCWRASLHVFDVSDGATMWPA